MTALTFTPLIDLFFGLLTLMLRGLLFPKAFCDVLAFSIGGKMEESLIGCWTVEGTQFSAPRTHFDVGGWDVFGEEGGKLVATTIPTGVELGKFFANCGQKCQYAVRVIVASHKRKARNGVAVVGS